MEKGWIQILKVKKIPNENTSSKCLSLIMLNFVIRVNKKHHPQTLLEECKYKIKKTQTENIIEDDLDPGSSDNEIDSDPDNDTDNELDNDETNE